MKLNTKFSLIIAFTVFSFLILTGLTQYWSRKNMSIKNYQYEQVIVQKNLSELINYINQLDFHQIMSVNAYRDYSEKFEAVDESLSYLVSNPIIRSFPADFRETLSQLEKLWGVNRTRYEKLLPIMEKIEAEKLSVSMASQVQKSGIRDAYLKYPENEQIQRLYEYVISVDAEFSGIFVGYTTMKNLINKASYEFEDILSKANLRYTLFAVIMALVICILLAVSISYVTFNIARRIISIREMSKSLAKKDFTISIDTNGSTEMQDLMNNMNNMVSELNSFLLIVKKTASKAISSGYQINDSANSTAAATTEIDANIESITKEFDMISKAVKKSVAVIGEMDSQVSSLVSHNERQTKSVDDANRTVIEVAETLEHITQMAEARAKDAQEMHDLVADGDNKVKLTANMLTEIKKQLKQIAGVVKIINDIASQTNLLSMNAAIEAAHAGEAGVGFSVVAEEIRSLAESTTVNAKKIRESVNSIVDTVADANDASFQASEAFGKVRENADQVVNSMQDISNDIVQVDEQMKSIRTKTEETAVAASEINNFCEQLAEKQSVVSGEVTSMNNLFAQAQEGIHEIKRGTSDIVHRITEVSDNSKDSYKNMTDLENVLEEFKTQDTVAEAMEQEDNANALNIKAEEIAAQAMSMAEEVLVSGDHSEIEFNLDDVEEVEF